jgi:ElaB/YqjD/DUF883 family membrane-anchored ribosome-binding protein
MPADLPVDTPIQTPVQTAEPPRGDATEQSHVQGFRERFESLLPEIQRRWPAVARHALEATRGSLDEVVHVIAEQSGPAASMVKQQLLELAELAGDQTQRLGENLGETLQPLEHQLEGLLDELNTSLRPRIEKPVRERPLLALGVAAGVGLVLGLLLASGRRSA